MNSSEDGFLGGEGLEVAEVRGDEETEAGCGCHRITRETEERHLHVDAFSVSVHVIPAVQHAICLCRLSSGQCSKQDRVAGSHPNAVEYDLAT